MYNHQLDTFLTVADCGSFSKAARQLFISSTAVMKQIDLLETRLEAQLFYRSYRGLILTEAGQSLYQDARYLKQFSSETVQRVRNARDSESGKICIGTSILSPVNFLQPYYFRLKKIHPELALAFAPYDCTPVNAREILGNLGRNIDVVFGIFDQELLKARSCAGTVLEAERICCAVPYYHPLADKDHLTYEDLRGEKIMVIHKGWGHGVDLLREDLQLHCPETEIIDFDFFSMETFNQCEQDGCLMIAVEEWENVHPFMKIIPVEWEHTILFGILHDKKPSTKVKNFICDMQQIYIPRDYEKGG